MTGYCDSKDNKFLPQITTYHNELKTNDCIDQYSCNSAASEVYFMTYEASA